MLHKRIIQLTLIAVLMVIVSVPAALSDNLTRDYNNNRGDDEDYGYMNNARTDRYLDVEIWSNHNDGEYYDGDKIVISFRANRDAFVAIYSIDTKGRVDLLFPAFPGDDNFVRGGVTYHLPGRQDDYDLVVSGPEGVENLQIIASREKFPIPDWYPVSGLVFDWEDRFDYMDYLNDRYFVSYEGQRFAYDRTSIYVNEWEEYYYRPVYYPSSQYWTVWGNAYIDYPFGASVYIDGIYWGVTPLYIPRIYVGWNTFTIYDRWGYCWESDIHVSRYSTVVLNNTIVRTSPSVQSKFKTVRTAGYRNPVSNGYPNYIQKKKEIIASKAVTTKKIAVTTPTGKAVSQVLAVGPKKHIRGSAKVVKTKRGWETEDITGKGFLSSKSTRSTYRKTAVAGKSKGSAGIKTNGYSSGSYGWGASGSRGKQPRGKATVQTGGNRSTHSSGKVSKRQSNTRQKQSSGYYQKKSGSKHRKNYDRKATIKSNSSRKGGSSYKAKSSRGSGSARSKGSTKSYRPSSRGKTGGSSYRPSGGSRSSGSKSSAPKSTGGSRSKGKGRR